MKTTLLIAIICLPFLMIILIWMHAPLFFQFHSTTRENHPTIFKIIGFNEKYIEDPKEWVRHFRLYVALIVVMITAILVSGLIEVGK